MSCNNQQWVHFALASLLDASEMCSRMQDPDYVELNGERVCCYFCWAAMVEAQAGSLTNWRLMQHADGGWAVCA
jgi:hypothetical protein